MFRFQIKKVTYSHNRDEAKIVDESIDGSSVVSTAGWRKTGADDRCSPDPFTKVYIDRGKQGKSHIVVAEGEDAFWKRLQEAKKRAESDRA